jgi:hypothetical protein
MGWSRRPSRDKGGVPSFIPVEEVEGEEDDQDEEDANGPEKSLPEGVPVLLGVKKNPEGHDQWNYIKENEKETHSGFSSKPAISFQLSANNPDDLGKILLGYPGEPRIMSGAGAGVQNFLK